MKFAELKKFLKTNVLNNYVLLGNDDFLLQKSLELIKESQTFEPEELNVIVFNENSDGVDVVKACNTMPMFSDYKLVYVNLSGDNQLQNANDLVFYLKQPNPSTILVINAGNDKTVANPFVKFAELVDCNKLDEKTVFLYVMSELKKYEKTIAQPALKLLCEYCLYQLTAINAEVQKLVAFVGKRNEINENDVKEIVNKSLDYQVFDLTDSLAKKDADKVYAVLNEMKAKKENDKLILPLVSSHFRRLLHARLNQGDAAGLAKLLNVKEYAVTVATRQSKQFSPKVLKQINDLCLELDYAVKSGQMLNDNAVQLLLLKILNM